MKEGTAAFRQKLDAARPGVVLEGEGILRGGSYFTATGSNWCVEGGPRAADFATMFLHMWPGLDRCATIGFRCVVDLAG